MRLAAGSGGLRRTLKLVVPNSIVREVRRLAGHTDEMWLRVVMNRDIEQRLAEAPVESWSVAEISGTAHEHRAWKSYSSLQYPEFDLLADQPLPEPFDLVICEQVLEHVPDPWRALDRLYEMVKPGGHLLVSTPFLVKIHLHPDDFWRFSPQALRLMLERAGFVDINVLSWGNRDVVRGNLRPGWRGSHRWQRLDNDPELPVVVWAMPRRPLEKVDP